MVPAIGAPPGPLPFPSDPQVAIFDARTARVTRLGLSLFHPFLAPFVRLFQGDGFVSIPVEERAQNADQNGDGDLEDFVLQLVDIASGRVTNTGAAVSPVLAETGRQGLGDAYACVVFEFGQGVDLNGDGDTDDSIVHAALLEDRDRDGIFDFADACVGRPGRCDAD